MFGRPKIKAKVIKIGKNVKFGKNIKITGFKSKPLEYLEIGDNCVFHDDVQIVCAPFVKIGKGNMFHNHVHVLGDEGDLVIGDYNWFGQFTLLDASGTLIIGDHNTIGYNCMIWSHAVRPACTYIDTGFNPTPGFDKRRKTQIGNYCWLLGGNTHVYPGVVVADYTMVLGNSVVHKNTVREGFYSGSPIKKLLRTFSFAKECDDN